jgi:hypothetical protein
MNTFVHLNYNTQHPGVARFERVASSAKNLVKRLQQESTYAAVLLIFGALSLVASIYDIVDASQEGHELGAWVVLWAALLVSAWGVGKFVVRKVTAWVKADREARMWDLAMNDHRIFNDVRSAQTRSF